MSDFFKRISDRITQDRRHTLPTFDLTIPSDHDFIHSVQSLVQPPEPELVVKLLETRRPVDPRIAEALAKVGESEKERVDKIQDPVIKKVIKLARTQMVRPTTVENGNYKYVLKDPNSNKHITVDKSKIDGIDHKIGNVVELIEPSGSDPDTLIWDIVDMIPTRVYPTMTISQRPVGATDYCELEDGSIPHMDVNCLLATVYDSFKTPTLTFDKFVQRVLESYQKEFPFGEHEWNNKCSLNQIEFMECVKNRTPVEFTGELLKPYLKRYNKEVQITRHERELKDNELQLIGKWSYGNTKKSTYKRNLLAVVMTDNHVGLISPTKQRTIKTNHKTLKSSAKYTTPKEYPTDVVLINNIKQVIDIIKGFQTNPITNKSHLIYDDDDTWGLFIYDIRNQISQIRIGKNPIHINETYPSDDRYLIVMLNCKNGKERLTIQIDSPYRLSRKAGLKWTPETLKDCITKHNNLLEMLSSSYTSSMSLELLQFITQSKTVPRAIIGSVESKQLKRMVSEPYRNTVDFSYGETKVKQVIIDISKAYPSVLCDMSGSYLPKFKSYQHMVKYNPEMRLRPFDIVLCKQVLYDPTDTERRFLGFDDNNFMYQCMFIQNPWQLHFVSGLKQFTKITGISPWEIHGVWRYSGIYKYDPKKHIYNTCKTIFNENKPNSKLLPNINTGKMEKTKDIKNSRIFKTLESVSEYAISNGYPLESIHEENITMPDGIEKVYYINIGTVRLTTNQIINKMLIHENINLKLIRKCKELISNYSGIVIARIATDSITAYIRESQYERFKNEYTKPTDVEPFSLIGQFFNEEKLNPLTVKTICDYSNIGQFLPYESGLPTLHVKRVNRVKINETKVKNDKSTFVELLNINKILIIEGNGGTGKDYCVHKHMPNTLSLCAYNSLSRSQEMGKTVHSFLGIGIDGTTGRVNKNDIEFDHLNISDTGLIEKQVLVILIDYILERQSKGLTTTLTLDRENQLPAISNDNAVYKGFGEYDQLDRLYGKATVIRFEKQERITNPEHQQNILSITKRVKTGECPYKVLSEFIPVITEQDMVNTFDTINDTIITQTNKRTNELNRKIIEQHYDNPYEIGMIMSYKGDNDYEKDIYKETSLKITKIDDTGLTLSVVSDPTTTIFVSSDTIKYMLSYTFCKTVYSFQGHTKRVGILFIDNPHHPLSNHNGKSTAVAITRHIDFDKCRLVESNKNYDWVNTKELITFYTKLNIDIPFDKVKSGMLKHKKCAICKCKVFAPYFEEHSMDVCHSLIIKNNEIYPICKKCHLTEI